MMNTSTKYFNVANVNVTESYTLTTGLQGKVFCTVNSRPATAQIFSNIHEDTPYPPEFKDTGAESETWIKFNDPNTQMLFCNLPRVDREKVAESLIESVRNPYDKVKFLSSKSNQPWMKCIRNAGNIKTLNNLYSDINEHDDVMNNGFTNVIDSIYNDKCADLEDTAVNNIKASLNDKKDHFTPDFIPELKSEISNLYDPANPETSGIMKQFKEDVSEIIQEHNPVWQQDKLITLEEVNLAFKIVMAEKEKDYGKETEDIPERN